MKRLNNKKTFIKTWFHRKKKTNKWQYIVNDQYAIKARKAWYRARSIYKLLEIQEKFEIIKPEYSVIDIWCAPWSFLQAIHNIVKEKTIIWVDIKECKPFSYKNVSTIVCDIFDYDALKKIIIEKNW
jgi:23S rRNA (uridine2552-2'-O)-methyltransferase